MNECRIKPVDYVKAETSAKFQFYCNSPYSAHEEYIKSDSFPAIQALDDRFVFRGHSENDWKLIPSFYREDNKVLLDALYGNNVLDNQLVCALSDFANYSDKRGLHVPGYNNGMKTYLKDSVEESIMFGKYPDTIYHDFVHMKALGQHYGLPTNLLDWSYDCNIAMYFAVAPLVKKIYDVLTKENYDLLNKWNEQEAGVWCLNITPSNYNDDDDKSNRLPFKLHDVPVYGNRNLQAQRGVFTEWEEMVSGKNITPMESIELHKDNYKFPMLLNISLPKLISPVVMSTLASNNISAKTIFPGYIGVTEFLKEKAMLQYIFADKEFLRLSKIADFIFGL
jgi:FRG domain